MLKCNIPICDYDALLSALNAVQRGEAHYIIYPRDVSNCVRIALAKLNIPPG